jgi:hypothetical protein
MPLFGAGLVAAGVVLRGHQNQPRTRLRGPLLLRGPSARLQYPEDRDVSREDANSDGRNYCHAKDQRHEKRNHNQPPFINLQYSDAASSTFVYAVPSIYLR